MTLPCGEEAMHAFALMAQAAKRITQGLGGELKDEARNNMTQQIFEHYKERVAEFERKWRLQKLIKTQQRAVYFVKILRPV